MVLGIYGGAGLGREVLVLAQQINAFSKRWSDLLLIDDAGERITSTTSRVITFDQTKAEFSPEKIEICIALGEPFVRAELYDRVRDAGYRSATIIHPQVHIPADTAVGSGTIISSSCFVSCGVCLGDNILLQPSSIVGHDCNIGPHSVLSTFVSLAGKCTIGARTFIGMNVPVKEGTLIGDDVIIGMGSVVVKDIESDMVALGNPARPMSRNESKRVFRK